MKRIPGILFLIALSVSLNAQPLSTQDQHVVDSIMNANYKPDEPGAVLLIAKAGKPIYRKAFGLSNLEFNVPNKPENIFRIASMTKQFTAVCVLQLAQRGKLNLQDDIKKYLPDYNSHGRRITIEHLLSHTSGIPDFAEKKDFPAQMVLTQSPGELMNFFMNDSLTFEPGTNWGYSNSGYVVAGLIVEKVSGLPLNEYIRENIFAPLDMNHSAIGNYDSLVRNASYGYINAASGKYMPILYMSWSWPYAAGNIISNVDDLLKWDNALYTEKILKKEWTEKAWRSVVLPDGQNANYGFGWTSNNYKGIQFIDHAGGMAGFSSDAIRIPSKQLYMVILSNKPIWTVPVLSSIALQLIHAPRQPINHLTQKALNDYTGVYAISQSFYAKAPGETLYQYFTVRDDTLFAQSPGYPKSVLVNVGKDLFAWAWWKNSYCEFRRDKKGKVISAEFYNEPVQTGPRNVQKKTDLPLPKAKQAVTLAAAKLALFSGKYDFTGGLVLSITTEGDRIYFQMPGQQKEEFFAENETNLFSKATDSTIEFTEDKGKISGMVFKVQGTQYPGKKME
ncbi:serine hydrolase [Chryseolinea lacunae]|uniref:Serine hydrolase n=1 Tax=Chryseolinea lacunae TaxID=2801331 RepID=A0ABS1L2C8_9BACT|nr:serine hydrolase [Chryseolinea lacunae]MBL0745863.1 serine hydrolase [Chryseolinea lacunae]